jgi:hypothetical protein
VGGALGVGLAVGSFLGDGVAIERCHDKFGILALLSNSTKRPRVGTSLSRPVRGVVLGCNVECER